MVFNAPSTCVRLGRQAVQLVRHGCQRSNDYPVGLSEWLGIVSHVVHGSLVRSPVARPATDSSRQSYSCRSRHSQIPKTPRTTKANPGPEGHVDARRRHFYSEEDAKQLRKGDEPEHDRSDKRRRFPHLSARTLLLRLNPGVYSRARVGAHG